MRYRRKRNEFTTRVCHETFVDVFDGESLEGCYSQKAFEAEYEPIPSEDPLSQHGPHEARCICPGCTTMVPGCWAAGVCRVCASEDCEHDDTESEDPLKLADELAEAVRIVETQGRFASNAALDRVRSAMARYLEARKGAKA